MVDTVPGIKGATASAQVKPATLETGLVVQVPPFVNMDDLVRVNTETGEYLKKVEGRGPSGEIRRFMTAYGSRPSDPRPIISLWTFSIEAAAGGSRSLPGACSAARARS